MSQYAHKKVFVEKITKSVLTTSYYVKETFHGNTLYVTELLVATAVLMSERWEVSVIL
jgi:hypothetical protein